MMMVHFQTKVNAMNNALHQIITEIHKTIEVANLNAHFHQLIIMPMIQQ